MSRLDPGACSARRVERAGPEPHRRLRPLLRGVAHWLYDGAEPPVQLGDSILGLEIIEAALRSAASGQVVGLDPAPAA